MSLKRRLSSVKYAAICPKPKSVISAQMIIVTAHSYALWKRLRISLSLKPQVFYRGLYHVLGGRISPLDGVGPEDLSIDKLIKRATSEDVAEVILATNPDIEGETTAIYLSKLLKKI